MDIVTTLRILIPQQHHIVHINHGGCGIFADQVREQILARGEECTVHLFADKGTRHNATSTIRDLADIHDLDMAINVMLDRAPRLPLDHMGIVYKGVLYDSDGDVTQDFDAAGEALSIATVKRMVNTDIWNNHFLYANNGSSSGLCLWIKKCFAVA